MQKIRLQTCMRVVLACIVFHEVVHPTLLHQEPGALCVLGDRYFEKGWALKALEPGHNNFIPWGILGACGGGTVDGTSFSEKDCCIKALELNPQALLSLSLSTHISEDCLQGQGSQCGCLGTGTKQD